MPGDPDVYRVDEAKEPGRLSPVATRVVENRRPIEQARAFRALMDRHGWSGHRLARELAIPQPAVVQALRLLELPAPVQARVEAGDLAPRTAYEISKLEDPAQQAELAERVVAEKLTRDQVAAIVRARKAGADVISGTGREEFRLEGGRRVVVSGLPDDRPKSILSALQEVIKTVQARIREAAEERGA